MSAIEPVRANGTSLGTGILRATPEDFSVVEEVELTPTGDGEHVWVRVKKCNANTLWVAGQLARMAGVSKSAVSFSH